MTEKLYHIIRIRPSKEYIDNIADRNFINGLRKKGKLQERSMKLIVFPFSYMEYKIHSPDRYSLNAVKKIFNHHVKTDDNGDLGYIMGFPYLVKQIIDAFFLISGSEVEKMNQDAGVLFSKLQLHRESLSTNESLMDRFIMTQGGPAAYEFFYNLTSMEKRMAFVALTEITAGFTLEERVTLAKMAKKPVDLHTSPYDMQRKLPPSKDPKGKIEEMTMQTSAELTQAMVRDKKLQDLGVKTKVNTNRENVNLGNI